MSTIEEYFELLNLIFDKAPKDVPERCEKIMSKYPTKIVGIHYDDQMIGGCLLVEIRKGFYGISWFGVHPEAQDCGVGKALINDIMRKYKGIFITKTRDAEDFYIKNGFTIIFNDGEHKILTKVNSKEEVDF